MKKHVNPELTDKDNPELTAKEIRAMRPAAEVLPPEFVSILPKRQRGQRGPQRSPVKQQVTLRLDASVLAFFKTKGRGWQTRINEALKHVVKEKRSA